MSLKRLLGLGNSKLADYQIIALIEEVRAKNLKEAEFDIGGERVKVSIPYINYDPDADNNDSW